MTKNLHPKESYLFILPWSLIALGGVNQVVENLFKLMYLDDKYNPMLLVNSWTDFKIRNENINGIEHFFFRLRSPYDSLKFIYNFTAFCFEIFRTTFFLNKFIKIHNVTVINVHYCGLFSLNIAFLKYIGFYNGQLILSFHGKDLASAKESRGIEKIFWKILLNSSDRIVACSESLKNEITECYKHTLNKISVIHNGIDYSLYVYNREVNSRFSSEKNGYLLNVATLEIKKGQDILVQAFGRIAQKFKDINLIIIGRPGGAESHIRYLIDSLGLSQRVLLYEGLPHAEVLNFMKNAKIFILPSRYEPFGIVILEAGAFGVPVIASNVGGVREIISHDKTGILCESEDIDCLASELSNLLEDSEKRVRLGENLKNDILNKYSWNITYNNYLKCINEKKYHEEIY